MIEDTLNKQERIRLEALAISAGFYKTFAITHQDEDSLSASITNLAYVFEKFIKNGYE